MRLAHLADRDDPLAVVSDGAVASLAGHLGGVTTIDALARAPAAVREGLPAAAERALDDAVRLEPGMLVAPLRRPGKIACVGLNYHDHIRETGLETPERPLIFAKFPSSLAGPGAPIHWPTGLTEQVDWEAELAVVVGRRMRDVPPEAALDHVLGYTAANDVSARDLQFSDGQWTRGKSLDSFCPVGPVLVTPEEFGDPGAKGVASRVNGEAMQQSSTAEMIFSTAEILSFLSRGCTLEAGDLVLTGTPWGVGGFRSPPVFLAAGDVVEVEVEGIGVLANPVDGGVAG